MLARTVLHLFLVATTYPSGIRSRSDGLPFGYSLEDGPLTWAEIPAAHNSSEDWSACRLGKQQSPIVVYTSKLAPLPTGALTLILPPFVSVLENLGTTLEVPAAQQGLLSFRGKSYTLDQFHFHTPSEHRIDDEYFPLEAHFVFSAQYALMHQRVLLMAIVCRMVHAQLSACSSRSSPVLPRSSIAFSSI